MGTTAEKLAALVASKADIAAAITEKGGTVPVRFSEYGDAIRAIESGSTSAIPREIKNGSLIIPSATMPMQYCPGSGVTSIGGYALAYAFRSSAGITKVDLSSVESLGSYALNNAFNTCSNLTEVDFSNLLTITADNVFAGAFMMCRKLTSIAFPRLTGIKGESVFSGAFTYAGLKTVAFPALKYICGSQTFLTAFSNCSNLESISFPELVALGYNGAEDGALALPGYGYFASAFLNCRKLTTLSFPKLRRIYTSGDADSFSVFYKCSKMTVINLPMLSSITGGGAGWLFAECSALTEIHFGAANEEAIRASAGFSTLWGRGAGAATVYFDL